MDQVWLCGNCHSLNEIRNKRCYHCRAARETSEQVTERGTAAGLGTGKLAKNPSLMGALFAGLVASVVAVLAWVYLEAGVARGQGRLAWLLGVLIGIAVLVGGRGRASFMSVVFSAVLTAGAIVAGEYLIASANLAEQSNFSFDAIAVAPPEAVIGEVQALLADDPLRPILWVVALGAAVAIPWRGLVGD
jgi:hypothetical protein